MKDRLVKKARKWLAMVLIAALCICNMAVPVFAEEAVGTSFRLSQTEGTVTVQNQNGKEIIALQDMKLFNGYQIDTAQKSYAWFEADSSKLFKMDAVSSLEVRKKGKQLELLLNSGNLFFNVTEHLQEDEVLNIRTSSMVVGIRGTSGWVKVIDQYHSMLYMLDGEVTAYVTDPVSGQRKSMTMRGGQCAEFWVYDKNKEGDKCDIIVRQFGEDEIEGFVAVELKKNQQLCDRIRNGGGGTGSSAGGNGTGAGFLLTSVIEHAEETLRKDQEEVAKKIAEIEKKIADLAHKVDVDPVFTNNTSKSDDGGSSGGTSGGSSGGTSGGSSGGTSGGSSGGTSTTPVTPDETLSDPTTLTMPVEDDTVHDYLNNKNVSVILQAGSDPNDNTFVIDSGLTVPDGKSLRVGTGISTSVDSGQTLQVDGHMETAGDLTNGGIVNSTSRNTLQIAGNFTNNGTLNNSTGRVIVKGMLNNSGTVNNSSEIVITGGTGSESGAANAITLTGGTLDWQSGTASAVVVDGGTLNAAGGTLESVDVQSGTFILDGATLSNGLKQTSTNAVVNLLSGTIQGNTEAALQVSGMISWNPNDAAGTAVTVTASTPGKLVKISDGGSIRYYDSDHNADVSLESGAWISCNVAGSTYTVQHIYGTAREALELQDTDYLVLSGENENPVADEKEILVLADKTMDLAGFQWKMPTVQIGEDDGNTAVEMTVLDSENNGNLVLPQEIRIGTAGTLYLKTDCERTDESRIVVNGTLYLQGERGERIAISQSGMEKPLEGSLIQADMGNNIGRVSIDYVDYHDMMAPFLDTRGMEGIILNHCSLIAAQEIMGSMIRFDSADYQFEIYNLDELEDIEIISNSDVYGPFMGCWDEKGGGNGWVSALISSSAQSKNGGVTIKAAAGVLSGMQGNEEYPGGNEYWSWKTDADGYCYLEKIDPAPQSIDLPIDPAEVSIPVATPSNAGDPDDEILDEDEFLEEEEEDATETAGTVKTVETASPSNAVGLDEHDSDKNEKAEQDDRSDKPEIINEAMIPDSREEEK